jgi:hypothetical protein
MPLLAFKIHYHQNIISDYAVSISQTEKFSVMFAVPRVPFPNHPPNQCPTQCAFKPISEVFHSLVVRFEQEGDHAIVVRKIATEYGLQHRRVYEFFNLLTGLGVCSQIQRGHLSWDGLSKIPFAIEPVYTEIEANSLNKSIDAVFHLSKSPSLGLIALRFLSLYLYLGVNSLSIKRVAFLFIGGKAGIKSLQRRMYLVLNLLEVLGTVQHAKAVSEYRLLLDTTTIFENAMKKRKQLSLDSPPELIETLLSRYRPEFLVQLHEQRMEAFTTLTNNAE